ncbi:DUF6924 domain-containing protein [Streptomyces sp. NPDC091972]|uniref:DUF6924 domain-containing protein n=1 Tax=Streptomyces sp. NPDC091972 TaxID=3366007 RepID=UPI00380D3EEF
MCFLKGTVPTSCPGGLDSGRLCSTVAPRRGRGRGRCLRAATGELGSIENNHSGANMDFEEVVGAVDDHGVFRGFCPAG